MKISDVFPSKYLTAADLNNKPYTLTIRTVTLEEMITHENKKVSKPVCWFIGAQKGFVMNVTNAHIIVGLYGDNTDDWTGCRITIYPTQVRAFGSLQDCIRVREEIPAQPKPAAAAAQVEEASGLDDDEDVLDEDGDGSLPTADASIFISADRPAKSPDDASPAQLLRLTKLMAQAYGRDWGQYEAECARNASKGAVDRFSDLKAIEATLLERKLEAGVAQVQVTNGKVAA
jgi:hypothetical protein